MTAFERNPEIPCAHASDNAEPCTGPPPILNVFPGTVPYLTQPQRRRVMVLRKKLRLEQERLMNQQTGVPRGENQQQVCLGRVGITSPFTGFEINWMTDEQTLVRMLVARDWSVQKAFILLLEAAALRRKLKPERIRPKDVKSIGTNGQIYRRGFDRHGRPLVYIRPSASPASAQSDDCIRLLVYTLERALQSFDRHAQPLVSSGVVFLVHLANYSNANQPPVDVALNFINIFQSIYAEQLAAAFLVDAPWYFETFWNCISRFLPERTSNKIKFLSTTQAEDMKVIFDQLEPRCVEDWIPGGLLRCNYNSQVYWAEEEIQFAKIMKFFQSEFVCKSYPQRLNEAKIFRQLIEDGCPPNAAQEKATQSSNASAAEGKPGTNDLPALEADDDEDSEEIEDIVSPTAAKDEEKRLLLQQELQRQQASVAEQPSKGDKQRSGSTEV